MYFRFPEKPGRKYGDCPYKSRYAAIVPQRRQNRKRSSSAGRVQTHTLKRGCPAGGSRSPPLLPGNGAGQSPPPAINLRIGRTPSPLYAGAQAAFRRRKPPRPQCGYPAGSDCPGAEGHPVPSPKNGLRPGVICAKISRTERRRPAAVSRTPQKSAGHRDESRRDPAEGWGNSPPLDYPAGRAVWLRFRRRLLCFLTLGP